MRKKPGWQVMFVPRATRTREGSEQPGTLVLQPRNSESEAGRASSLTTVPTEKNAEQSPEPLPRMIVQSMPAGEEVTRPLPVPPGRIEMLPLLKWNSVYVVMMSYLWVLQSPPTVPTMIAEPVVSGAVATGKVALVAPGATVTLAGTVAMCG